MGINGVGHGLPLQQRLIMKRLSHQLIAAFFLILLATSALVGLLIRWQTLNNESATLQRLSAGLAAHIVGHWPVVTQADQTVANKQEQAALLDMLMTVNPAIQVYILDANGKVKSYLGDSNMVRTPQVDLAPVRAFLSNQAFPIRSTDPMGGSDAKLFSAAMFPAAIGQTSPPGYLYVVLDGAARESIAKAVYSDAWAVPVTGLFLGCFLLALLAWIIVAKRLTRPLDLLAEKLEQYRAQEPERREHDVAQQQKLTGQNEFTRINAAFDSMANRIEYQREQQALQAQGHREAIAGIAHDLRTPLTALHGYLEALKNPATAATQSIRLLDIAIAQSDKVRRLSRQLFELAVLQSSTELLTKERFNLDELISDTVQKFELSRTDSLEVVLAGVPPGRVELEGDMQMIERAITNLIENAGQHSPGKTRVDVSIEQTNHQINVLVCDNGPGLPPNLIAQLERRQPLKPTPARKRTGGLGGLGLSIAQRIAILHGGHLLPIERDQGGTALCFSLPMRLKTH
jgi:signal transduction histidine kinase